MNAPLGRGRPGKRANRTPDINPWRHEPAPQQQHQQQLGDYNQGKHANNDHLGPGLVPDVGAERVHRGRHAGRDADHLGANLVPDASMGGGMRNMYEGAGAAGSPELAAAYAEIVRLQAMVDMLSKQLNEQGGHVPYGVAMQHRGSEASYEPER